MQRDVSDSKDTTIGIDFKMRRQMSIHIDKPIAL